MPRKEPTHERNKKRSKDVNKKEPYSQKHVRFQEKLLEKKLKLNKF